MVYRGHFLEVHRFIDESFQSEKDDNKLQSGLEFNFNSRAVSWKCLKQNTTADSTIEAEYIAILEDIKETVWIKKFITEL